jgi:hypothetical protein
MKRNHFKVLLAVMGALSLAACGGVRASESAAIPLGQRASQGETIYFGRVFPLGAAGDEPGYVYERRVDQTSGGNVSTHITRDLSGSVVLADVATHADDYTLIDYTLLGNQLSQRGTIRVEGDQLRFELDAGGEHRSAVEPSDANVVVGPTLVGYIVRHLEALRAGSVIPVRFALIDRLETLTFDLEASTARSDETRIEMRPSNLLLSALIDPIVFTFDARSAKLVRLEGRVPPKRKEGEWLKDLDARVEYSFVAAEYR